LFACLCNDFFDPYGVASWREIQRHVDVIDLAVRTVHPVPLAVIEAERKYYFYTHNFSCDIFVECGGAAAELCSYFSTSQLGLRPQPKL
jgi:hypothetical protein